MGSVHYGPFSASGQHAYRQALWAAALARLFPEEQEASISDHVVELNRMALVSA